jgi:hypothetical protein
MAKRGTPKPITPGTLHNSFDRRSIIVGTLQGASASPWPRGWVTSPCSRTPITR